MRRSVRGLVVASIWAASSGSLALPSLDGPVIEEQDGTLLLADKSNSANRLYEWRRDQTFDSHVPPFGPFVKRDPRGSFGDRLMMPTAIAGTTGVVVDGTIFYKRSAGGTFEPAPLFNGDGGPLPCLAPANLGCALFTVMKDDAGSLYYFAASLLDGQLNLSVETQGQIHLATAAEALLSYGDLTFSGTESAAFIKDEATSSLAVLSPYSAGLVVSVLSGTGRVSYDLPLNTDDYVYRRYLFRRAGQVYAAVKVVNTGGKNSSQIRQMILKVNGLFDGHPTVETVLEMPASGSAVGFQADERFAYLFKEDNSLVAWPLQGGAEVPLATCVGYSAVIAEQSGAPSVPVFAGCTGSVLTIVDGAITDRLPISERVSAGRVVKGHNGHATALFSTASDRILRVFAGKTDLLDDRLQMPPPPEILRQKWLEGERLCGSAGQSTRKVYCRVQSQWSEAVGHPPVYEVAHYPSGLWGLGYDGTDHIVYRLDEQTGWAAIARTRLDTPDPTQAAHFVASEGFADVIAIDPPSRDFILKLSGQSLVKTNIGTRRGTDSRFNAPRPVLSADGGLYTRCGDDLCIIAIDGTASVIANTSGSGNYVPLMRGVLFWADAQSYVMRGTRAMRLDTLFGQLHSTPERKLQFETASLFGKGQLISVTVERAQPRSQRYFLFDGSTLQEYAPSVVASIGFEQDDDGFSRTAGSTASLSSYSPQTYVAQKLNGLFTLGDGHDNAHRHELGAAFGHVLSDPNKIRAVVRHEADALFATDGGVIACAENAGMELIGPVAFAKTQGCRVIRDNGPVSSMAQVGPYALVMEGWSVSRLDGGVLSQGRARGLLQDLREAVWIEDDQRLAVLQESGVIERVDLPAGAEAASARYACTRRGLFHRTQRTWVGVAGIASCNGIAGRGDDALVMTALGTVEVVGGVAAAVVALPGTMRGDAVIGVYGDAQNFAVAVGTHIFTLQGTAYVEVTPEWDGQSAIRASVVYLGRDGVGLDGGGAVVTESGARFFRLQ